MRAHPSEFGATEFDARAEADNRFSPILVGRRIVPVLYGAADAAAAASETIFHTVPAAEGSTQEVRPRQVTLGPYVSWVWSSIASRRDLTLVSMRGHALDQLGSSRSQLILSGRASWPITRQWSRALYGDAPDADGLWWSSRQAPRRDAIMLFGRRRGRSGGVARSVLEVVEPPVPFLAPQGYERLAEVANGLDITVLID